MEESLPSGQPTETRVQRLSLLWSLKIKKAFQKSPVPLKKPFYKIFKNSALNDPSLKVKIGSTVNAFWCALSFTVPCGRLQAQMSALPATWH